MKFFLFIIILVNLNIKINASEIYGFAIITDGDTIKILDNKIRLHGIDAPERNQQCIKNTKKYNCGTVATMALIKKINKNLVRCEVQKKKDRYSRYIGVCFIMKEDLNKWMVRNGYAVAYRRYSKDYILDEKYAKTNKVGLWSGIFINPEKWRKLN
tara:strand:+ start:1953 stop:2420 length:468 start_codon:yes stop_codon:yes gene_type:complete